MEWVTTLAGTLMDSREFWIFLTGACGLVILTLGALATKQLQRIEMLQESKSPTGILCGQCGVPVRNPQPLGQNKVSSQTAGSPPD